MTSRATPKIVTHLDAFRARIGKPIERFRRGIYALLVPKKKAGKVIPITKPPVGRGKP